jgi:DNA invertase Pin-like site-specific DNA recombinase
VRLSGTVYCHKTMRKSYSEVGFLSGRRAPSATACGRLTIFAGVAEFERALIRHRTDKGRQAAKRRGVSFGRPQKLRPDQKTLALSLVQEGRSISEVARTFNVHLATIHRLSKCATGAKTNLMTVHRPAQTHGPL